MPIEQLAIERINLRHVAINRDSRCQARAGLLIAGRGDNFSDKTAKEIDGEFAPQPGVLRAVKNLFSNKFEQRMRSGEIEECFRLARGDKLRAPFDETRA